MRGLRTTHEGRGSTLSDNTMCSIVKRGLKMSNSRQDILYELEKRQANLSSIYNNGVMLLDVKNLSNRLHLSAHCMREVIEKLERCLIVYEQGDKSLKSSTMALQEYWHKTVAREAITMDLPWPLDTQGDIQSFLARCEKFLSDSSLILMKQKEIALAVVQELMRQSGVDELPAAILTDKAETWFKCKEYFIATSHHRSTTEDVFQAHFSALEILFHGLLVPPRTFENMQKILDIIEKGEGNAKQR